MVLEVLTNFGQETKGFVLSDGRFTVGERLGPPQVSFTFCIGGLSLNHF